MSYKINYFINKLFLYTGFWADLLFGIGVTFVPWMVDKFAMSGGRLLLVIVYCLTLVAVTLTVTLVFYCI